MDYKPFQPISETIKQCDSISYKEYTPSEYLQPYISSYWTMTSRVKLEKQILHRVVPDGCVDIIFDLSNNLYCNVASVVGTMTKPLSVILEGHVNYIAIRFLPGGYVYFFRNPLHHFTDHITPFEATSEKKGRELIERVTLESCTVNRIKVLERYLGCFLMTNEKKAPLIGNTINNIIKRRGNIRISQLTKLTNSNERQLRRKFSQWLGVSPKTFCKIIRFQNILQMMNYSLCPRLLPTALGCGYYDQSHFIHEFSTYYGLGPLEFLRTKFPRVKTNSIAAE